MFPVEQILTTNSLQTTVRSGVTKTGKKSGAFLYILYMAENEHQLVSWQECRSLPSKYREGAELREGTEPIKAVREKALVGGTRSPGCAVAML